MRRACRRLPKAMKTMPKINRSVDGTTIISRDRAS
jgi:hypothetical protein